MRRPEQPSFEEMIRALKSFFGGGKLHPTHIDVTFSDGSHFACPLSLFPDATTDCRHAPDFASVVWHGTPYAFTPAQRPAVALLWKAWEEGTPPMSGQSILESIDSEAKDLRDLFRGTPAWETMICRVDRGVYALGAAPGS